MLVMHAPLPHVPYGPSCPPQWGRGSRGGHTGSMAGVMATCIMTHGTGHDCHEPLMALDTTTMNPVMATSIMSHGQRQSL